MRYSKVILFVSIVFLGIVGLFEPASNYFNPIVEVNSEIEERDESQYEQQIETPVLVVAKAKVKVDKKDFKPQFSTSISKLTIIHHLIPQNLFKDNLVELSSKNLYLLYCNLKIYS